MPVVASSTKPAVRSTIDRMARPSGVGDRVFKWLTLAMALAVVALVFLVGWQLARGSSLAIQKFGFHFLETSTWDPVAEQFGDWVPRRCFEEMKSEFLDRQRGAARQLPSDQKHQRHDRERHCKRKPFEDSIADA